MKIFKSETVKKKTEWQQATTDEATDKTSRRDYKTGTRTAVYTPTFVAGLNYCTGYVLYVGISIPTMLLLLVRIALLLCHVGRGPSPRTSIFAETTALNIQQTRGYPSFLASNSFEIVLDIQPHTLTLSLVSSHMVKLTGSKGGCS